MKILWAVMTEPIAFVVGLALLLLGVWLLRKGGLVVLIFLGFGVANSINNYLSDTGLLPNEFGYAIAVYAALLITVFVTSRNPVVAQNAEFLFTALLCLFAGETLSEWLFWPTSVFLLVALSGAVLSPVLVVALIASALLNHSLGVATVWLSTTIFLGCLLIVRLQHGAWLRGYWDPELTRDLRRLSGKVAIAGSPELVQVVFASQNAGMQKRVIDDLERQSVKCHRFPGGSAGAEIPVSLIERWRKPWPILWKARPDSVFSGRSEVTTPPVTIMNSAVGVSLNQVANVLRSHAGKSLPKAVATGKGVRIAVLDTGINDVTPALRKSLKTKVSFVPHEPDGDDHRDHGTAVAACVVAVAPDVELISVKVLDRSGKGTLFSVLRGLQFVAENRDEIDAMNLSLGAKCGCGNGCPLCQAVNALAETGIPSCCAIGNSGPLSRSVECPGASAGTLGVAALDIDLHVAQFSSRGPSCDGRLRKPDLANFGVNLQLPNRNGEMIVASGTSFASPLTAGVMAGCLENSKKMSASAIYEVLRNSCIDVASDSCDPNTSGAGLVSLGKAVSSRTTAKIHRFDSAPSKRVWQRTARRAVAVAACLMMAGLVWQFGFDHIGMFGIAGENGSDPSANKQLFPSTITAEDAVGRPHAHPRRLLLLGRVRKSDPTSQRILLDDGTGVARVHWTGLEGTLPCLDAVVVISGVQDDSNRINGQWRVALLPGQ